MMSRVLVVAFITLLVGVAISQLAAGVGVGVGGRSAEAGAMVIMIDGVPTVCGTVGQDVIVYELPNLANYSALAGIDAFSVGTTSANLGDADLNWTANNNQHPVIGQNLYQLKNGRFRHIGQSWLKHGFFAINNDIPECSCQDSGTGSALGPGCADPYGAGLNGQQDGLGPKFEVNAHTGFYPYPPTDFTNTGNSIYKRLQVRTDDLDPAIDGGGLYFVEGQYVQPEDAGWENDDNNSSYREVEFSGGPGNFTISFAPGSTTQRELPAITAWKDADPLVDEQWVQVPGEGTAIVSGRATDLGGGQWHYEYAIYNMNSDRSFGAFSVPIPTGTTVSNVGFHDVDYHSGEPYSDLQWANSVTAGAVTWTTESFNANADANAIRWGTLYNFWFDCDAAPSAGMNTPLTLGLFKPGADDSFRVHMTGPDVLAVDCNGNGIDDLTDIADATSADDNSNGIPDECESVVEAPIASVVVAAGLSQPVGVAAPPGDFDRLFVIQQTGEIRIIDLTDGSIRVQKFLDLSGQITSGGERGLLGLVFDPDYKTNGHFYVNYTDTNGDTQVSRFTVSADPDVADDASEHPIITVAQDFANHNGGQIAFGPDGMLYIGMGDGGSGNDPNQRAQDPQSLLGKMLRIDVHGDSFPADPDRNYAIPGDNPYVAEGSILSEIWAFGLRNPWRFSFDRLTGDLFVGDVGQAAWEEINFQSASSAGGENYGWRCYEGDDPNSGSGISTDECPPAPDLTFPVHVIEHLDGVCSVIGGYVYRGSEISGLSGAYFYADYCADFIESFRVSNGTAYDFKPRTAEIAGGALPIESIVSFGEDAAGEMYIVSGLGAIYKIVPAGQAPVCGNGIVEEGELCDDGNTTPDDGCTNCQPDGFDNDNCVDAFEVCHDDLVTGTTTDATADGSGECEFGSSTSADRWYKYTAPADGDVTLDLCASSYDTYVGVHAGCPGDDGNELFCDDDSCPTGGFRSALTFPVIEGETYYIRVAGFGGSDVGDYSMAITGPQCELPDCNGNGVDDALDIAGGASLDCNKNGIPDECDYGVTTGHPIAVKPPLAIPDNTPTFTTHTFNLPDAGIITDVDVDLLIDHTWNGDLIVRLSHNGKTIDLINRPGGDGSGTTFDGDGYDITLDDEGTGGFIETVNDPAGVTSPPSYKPDMALSAFDGMDQSGPWTLEISDNASGDTGELLAWGLTVTTAGGPNPCDCNDNGIEDADEIAGDPSLDLDLNGQLDSCQIATDPTLDLDGGPVGVREQGDNLLNTFCSGCHNTDGAGGKGFPGPNIRNKSRRELWQKLWPPTDHPGGAFAGFVDQDFADLEAYLSDAGSRGRPDRMLDAVQTLDDCDTDGDTDGYELEFGTQTDLNYDGLPDECFAFCEGDVFTVSTGMVDVLDLLAVLGDWGQTGPPRPNADVAPFPTGDGVVDVLDLLAVLGNWGMCE